MSGLTSRSYSHLRLRNKMKTLIEAGQTHRGWVESGWHSHDPGLVQEEVVQQEASAGAVESPAAAQAP